MGVDARGFPGGLLRLDPAFAYVEPPSSWPLPWAECLTPAPNTLPGKLTDPGIKRVSLTSPALSCGIFTSRATWEALKWSESCSVVSDSVTPFEFFRPEYWSGELVPSPGIFPIQGLNPSLLHCKQILYCLSFYLNYFFKDPISKVGGMKTSRYRFVAGRYIQSIRLSSVFWTLSIFCPSSISCSQTEVWGVEQ